MTDFVKNEIPPVSDKQLNDLKTFLKYLGPIQIFSAKNKHKPINDDCFFYYDHPNLKNILIDANNTQWEEKRSGYFYALNPTENGKWREEGNITEIRRIGLDFDEPEKFHFELIDDLPLEPSTIVESSPGKYQLTFKLTGCPVDEYKPLVTALIEKYDHWGSDKSAKDPARLYRLPGSVHRKVPTKAEKEENIPISDPFISRLIDVNDNEYTLEEFKKAFQITSYSNSVGTVGTRYSKDSKNKININQFSGPTPKALFNAMNILNGDHMHNSALSIAGSLASYGVDMDDAHTLLETFYKTSKRVEAGEAAINEELKDLNSVIRSSYDKFHKGELIEWGEIIPLNQKLAPVKKLNLDDVPVVFKNWIKESAKTIGVVEDFYVVNMYILAFTFIGKKITITPKQNSKDWNVALNNYGLVCAPPSKKKTPAYNACMFPIKELNRELKEQVDKNIEERSKAKNTQEYKALKRKLNAKEKKQSLLYGKDTPDADGQADAMNEEIENLQYELDALLPEEIPSTRISTNSSTVAKLEDILSKNNRCILVERDELSAFFKEIAKPGREEERGFFLEAWNGNMDYQSDRVSRGETFIKDVTLCLLGNIQPIVLKELFSRGDSITNDGFLQRFQLMVYPDLLEIDYTDIITNNAIKDSYKNKMIELFYWMPDFIVINQLRMGNNFPGKYNSISFTPDAQELFTQWSISNEKNASKEEKDIKAEGYSEYLSKLPNTLVSIAAVNEILDSDPIDSFHAIGKESLQQAINLVEYFKSHAFRILSMNSSKEVRMANRILESISIFPNPFTSAQVKANFSTDDFQKDSPAVIKALDCLVERNYLHMIIKKRNNAKNVYYYYKNPKIILDS